MLYPIGTRVRLAHSKRHPESIGQEGIIACYKGVVDGLMLDADYGVDFPGDINGINTTLWGCDHDQLEPIINDGNDLSTWDEVLNDTGWQPGKVMA